MSKKLKLQISLALAAVIAVGILLWWYLSRHTVDVLSPRGIIGSQEKQLIIIATLLALLVIIPVYFMTFFFALKYRQGNHKAKKYMPDWDGHRGLELLWWGIPFAIIFVLAIITWQSSHQLDPFRPLASSRKPLTIQVVAMDWKWLFIYPEQDVASVNFVQFPVNTPVDFEITADAPMNSFWIPRLGGQIYAMPGMATELHLMAGTAGDYKGSSANISGRGFAGMEFTARASSQGAFNGWVAGAKHSSKELTTSEYATLAKPSENNPVTIYHAAAPHLFEHIIDKYMLPKDEGGAE